MKKFIEKILSASAPVREPVQRALVQARPVRVHRLWRQVPGAGAAGAGFDDGQGSNAYTL